MTSGQLYCLGFIFDMRFEYGYFIKKLKPEWQKNKLNGIGGKVEKGETFLDAIIRESFEEINYTGHWTQFGIMGDDQYSKWRCGLFYSILNGSPFIHSKESEQLECVNLNDVPHISYKFIDNVPCLINFAMYHYKLRYCQNVFLELNYTTDDY